jgi:hypothetical protein
MQFQGSIGEDIVAESLIHAFNMAKQHHYARRPCCYLSELWNMRNSALI